MPEEDIRQQEPPILPPSLLNFIPRYLKNPSDDSVYILTHILQKCKLRVRIAPTKSNSLGRKVIRVAMYPYTYITLLPEPARPGGGQLQCTYHTIAFLSDLEFKNLFYAIFYNFNKCRDDTAKSHKDPVNNIDRKKWVLLSVEKYTFGENYSISSMLTVSRQNVTQINRGALEFLYFFYTAVWTDF